MGQYQPQNCHTIYVVTLTIFIVYISSLEYCIIIVLYQLQNATKLTVLQLIYTSDLKVDNIFLITVIINSLYVEVGDGKTSFEILLRIAQLFSYATNVFL